MVWSRPYTNYIKHHQFIWSEVKKRCSGKILDLGCGSSIMWNGEDVDLTGVDFSLEAIQQSLINYPNGHFRVSSVESVPLTDKFETVVLCGVVNYFQNLEKIKNEAVRLCGGKIIVTINRINDFPGREWDEKTIMTEFSRWGKIQEVVHFPGIIYLIVIAV